MRSERYLFVLFLVRECGAVPGSGVDDHVEWVFQRQFKTPCEWKPMV